MWDRSRRRLPYAPPRLRPWFEICPDCKSPLLSWSSFHLEALLKGRILVFEREIRKGQRQQIGGRHDLARKMRNDFLLSYIVGSCRRSTAVHRYFPHEFPEFFYCRHLFQVFADEMVRCCVRKQSIFDAGCCSPRLWCLGEIRNFPFAMRSQVLKSLPLSWTLPPPPELTETVLDLCHW